VPRTSASDHAKVVLHFAIGSVFIFWGFLGAVPLLFIVPMAIPAVLFAGGAIAGLCLQSEYPGAIWRMGLSAIGMGIAGLVLIPMWIPRDASSGSAWSLLLTVASIFGAGLPFLFTIRDDDGVTHRMQAATALGLGACIAAVAALALVWSGQTERWMVIGVAFPLGFIAIGTVLNGGGRDQKAIV
jgi:hypothetical protein